MHTLVLIALILLVFGVGPRFVGPNGQYSSWGYYGVGLTLIMLCVLYLMGNLVLR
jgi:hypothetical protein